MDMTCSKSHYIHVYFVHDKINKGFIQTKSKSHCTHVYFVHDKLGNYPIISVHYVHLYGLIYQTDSIIMQLILQYNYFQVNFQSNIKINDYG